MPPEQEKSFPAHQTYSTCVFRPVVSRPMLNFDYEIGKDYKFEYVHPVYAGRTSIGPDGEIFEQPRLVHPGYYRVWPGNDYAQREACSPKVFDQCFSKVASPQDILNLVAPETI